MRHFDYKDGVMHAEDVSLARIAQEVGTPVYVYSQATLTRHFNVFKDAFKGRDVLIAYSVKANSNLAVLSLLAKLGAGADVVLRAPISFRVNPDVTAGGHEKISTGKAENKFGVAWSAAEAAYARAAQLAF